LIDLGIKELKDGGFGDGTIGRLGDWGIREFEDKGIEEWMIW
jgi:hypothetical protein